MKMSRSKLKYIFLSLIIILLFFQLNKIALYNLAFYNYNNYINNGELFKAEDELENILSIHTNKGYINKMGILKLADIKHELYNLNASIENYQKLIDIYPKDRKINKICKEKIKELFLYRGNLNITKITSDSYNEENFAPDKTVDKNSITYWESMKLGKDHWIEYEIFQRKPFNKIKIILDNNIVKGFKVQFFHQGNWTDILEIENPKRINEYNITGRCASVIRLLFKNRDLPFGYARVYEFDISLSGTSLLNRESRLEGMVLPVKYAEIPYIKELLPNAPRKYRGGVHRGFDFTHIKRNGIVTKIKIGTPVRAVKDGIIIMANNDYKNPDRRKFNKFTYYLQDHMQTSDIHSFGGKQIWIDHGQGIVTIYNHLHTIAPHIKTGVKVKKRERIGTIGVSGSKSSVKRNGSVHLHFELWIDGHFFGEGVSQHTIYRMFHSIF